ncbi:MAG: AMP-binding protein [Planctomycetes bacterium]|nr:AMP-binding protein [Planctomycetota bacterium]
MHAPTAPRIMWNKRAWTDLSRTPAAQLRQIQDEALARYVQEELYPFSAAYRAVFDGAGVRPEEIRGVADLARLPFTTKQDLLKAQSDPLHRYDFILRPTPETIRRAWPIGRKLSLVLGGLRAREELTYRYTPHFLTFTTGRSSDPVAFAYTPHDLELLGEAIARMFDIARIDAVEERVLNLFPFAPHLAFWALTIGGFTTGRMVVPSGGGKVMGTDGNLRLAERINATALVGTPGFLYHMLRQAAEEKRNLSRVSTIVLGAEKVPPGLKHKMAEALAACGAGKVTILGTYGFTEARMAFAECPTAYDVSSGYHLHPDLGVFEVIDPKTGAVLPERTPGELVYTGIGGHGTTVLRYRTGDLCVEGLTYEPCPHCGRTLPRIGSELKRVSEQHALSITKIKGTLVDLSAMGSVLMQMRDVEEWQVVLKKKNNDPLDLDELEVRFSPRKDADVEATAKSIRQGIHLATEVVPNRIEAVPLPDLLKQLGMESEMKEKRYLDLRPK